MKIEYAVQIIWSPEDNAYLAIPAELIGCMADGKTPEEALANLKVVIEEWIEVAAAEGRPIPSPATIEDLVRVQQQSQIDLQQHIENEVKKAVSRVLEQLLVSQQSSPSWNLRGGLAFNPSEHLEVAGKRR